VRSRPPIEAGPPPSMASHQHPQTRALSWGLLFSMLGLVTEASASFGSLKDDPGLAALVAAMEAYLRSRKPSEDERVTAGRIVEELGKLLDPTSSTSQGPNLSRECPRCPRRREADDDPKRGYSRDAFKRVAEPRKDEVALGAVAYLVRAHALFFAHPRGWRSFNAAKVALNDLFQATQLAC